MRILSTKLFRNAFVGDFWNGIEKKKESSWPMGGKTEGWVLMNWCDIINLKNYLRSDSSQYC